MTDSIEDVAAEMSRLSGLLDTDLNFMGEQVKAYAEAERDYRKAKSQAWVKVRIELPNGVVPEREAWVNATTAELRMRRDIAEGMRDTARQAIYSRRAQISALQSLLARDRVEAEFARTGPEWRAA